MPTDPQGDRARQQHAATRRDALEDTIISLPHRDPPPRPADDPRTGFRRQRTVHVPPLACRMCGVLVPDDVDLLDQHRRWHMWLMGAEYDE